MGRVTASDAELVEASRRGERAAFGELVERYQRIVCAVGYSATSDRSLGEDVAQDTFVAAFHQLDQLRDVSRLREWLCGIARNLARKARRVREREDEIDETQPDLAGTPFDEASERERDTVVAAALQRVPETYREALVLYYVEQRSVAAVASALGISVDAVHQRLSRGRQLVAVEVAEVVEHTLERRRTRRNLAVTVLAALPIAVAPAHANASPGGTSMLKLGIAASLVAALAGTGYVVHAARHASSPDASSSVTTSTTRVQRHPTIASSSSSTSSRRGPIAASVPPSLPAGAIADHAPYDCAAAAKHLTELATQIGSDQPPLEMTREQADKLRAGFDATGTGMVVVEDAGSATGPTMTAKIGGGGEQQCLSEHWSQSLIDCLATADDLWTSAVQCAEAEPHEGPTAAQIAAVTDWSCPAVASHIAGLIVPPTTIYAPMDIPSTVIAGMNARFAELPETIEASCASSDWSDGLRRCLVAADSVDAIRACN